MMDSDDVKFVFRTWLLLVLMACLVGVAFADELPADLPEVPVKAVAKEKPKGDTLRVEKVSRPLSDQTMMPEQLLVYLSSKRSFAPAPGCMPNGFLTCQGQGAHVDGVPAATDEGRYRPRPGTIRGYHE
ncbi:hypothetical protein [Collimonas fungivorans]|uniref:hypothetical protein n=1 Tax=Collimonas fungivorans TaxID=158899 RepID=UPI0005A2C9A3|nr:hypothetical protein [Collimonas fungivorans]